MKKILNYLLVGVFLLTFTINVSAKEVSPNDIENNSYVIGNILYTSDTVLSTRHIMLAARTVQGNKTDEMIIYYKTPRGKWIEGLSGESITIPNSFDIKFTDVGECDEAPGIGYTFAEYDSSNVDNNTYVIGDYMFSSNTVLSTRHIMLAARTIFESKLEDMIIYYRTPRGVWIEGLSGKSITPPKTFEIAYSDSKKIFNLNFDANGGENDFDRKRIVEGSTFGELPLSTRPGYTFNGWYTSKTGGTKVESTNKYTSTSDTVLYAHWTANKYKVTFDANEGEVTTTSKEVTFDSKYGELPTPSRVGYTFNGWYTTKENGIKIESTTKYSSPTNSTLYAHWTAIKYTVTFDANEGEVTTTSKEVTFDSNYGELPTPSRVGYTFNGWYTAKENGTKIESTTKYSFLTNSTLYAQWTANKYTITFDATRGEVTTSSKEITFNSEYGELPIPTRKNYIFKGWYTKIHSGTKIENTTRYTLLSDSTLYADWEPIPTLVDYFKDNHISQITVEGTNINEKIKNITFQDKINIPTDVVKSWDIGAIRNGDVMAYLIKNSENESYYDMYIQSDTQLYANEDMSWWFYDLKNLDSINGLDLVNTKNVTSMKYMFSNTGYNSSNFTLDLSNLDTSKVTDMSGMFDGAGYNSTNFILDVSNFDTSNVTDMNKMFYDTGYNNTNFTLDLSNFDTSKVTDMSNMFYNTGYNSTNFILDVSNFDTSNVTDMNRMFVHAGYNSRNLTIDLSNADVSNVTDMSWMFWETGYNSRNLTIDLSNADASNVTNMSYMFSYAGYNSTNLTIDLSNTDVSNVTNMSEMFRYAGKNATTVSINIENLNTSKATNMSEMFHGAGRKATTVSINVKNLNTSNVTDMSGMFRDIGVESTNDFVLDLSSFDTSNVTDMSYMFSDTAEYNSNYKLILSDFDTRKVTNMDYMFSHMGKNSPYINISITIESENPDDVSYYAMLSHVALVDGAQITINYTSETSYLVDCMIAQKVTNSNVVKGVRVD